MTTKFSHKIKTNKAPAICKAVSDSLRVTTIPFKKDMQFTVNANSGITPHEWEVIGSGILRQQGNPLQIWISEVGDTDEDYCIVRLDYETEVNVLTIHFFAFKGILPILTRVRILANIDLERPFGTFEIELPPDPPGGRIILQLLY